MHELYPDRIPIALIPSFEHLEPHYYYVPSILGVWSDACQRLLKPDYNNSSGYARFQLSTGRGRANVYLHDIVAAHAFGPKPPGQQVRHLDGNHLNNTPENLRYGPAQDNADDRIAHGNSRKTRLPDKLAFELLYLQDGEELSSTHGPCVAKPLSIGKIARIVGVAPQVVSKLFKRTANPQEAFLALLSQQTELWTEDIRGGPD